MKRSFWLVFCLLIVLSVAFGGAIKDGSLAAYSNGTNIVVRWVSEDEAGVKGYVIERKAGMEGPFALLTNPQIAPTGNGSSYEFVDNTAFRVTDNIYQYRITAIGTGAVYYVSVNHSVSGVRRTWGSIKAMFR